MSYININDFESGFADLFNYTDKEFYTKFNFFDERRQNCCSKIDSFDPNFSHKKLFVDRKDYKDKATYAETEAYNMFDQNSETLSPRFSNFYMPKKYVHCTTNSNLA